MFEQLGVGRGRGHRRSQLVGRISDELAHPGLGRSQLVERLFTVCSGIVEPIEHRIECLREVADLGVVISTRHAEIAEVAVGDCRRARLDLPKGT